MEVGLMLREKQIQVLRTCRQDTNEVHRLPRQTWVRRYYTGSEG